LTQAFMAELFQVTPMNLTLNLKGIYAEVELHDAATCKEYLHVRSEGNTLGGEIQGHLACCSIYCSLSNMSIISTCYKNVSDSRLDLDTFLRHVHVVYTFDE
jgi:hypothetical protein